ncbi:MAG: hypothetical protein ACK4M7_08650, partial [Burkholderiales bacterium]
PVCKQCIQPIAGISKIVEVVEDHVLVTYQGRKLVAKLKGVSDNFIDQSPLEPYIIQGSLRLKKDNQNLAIIGAGIQGMLFIQLSNPLQTLQVYYPKNIKAGKPISQPFYAKQSTKPGAV